MIPISTKSKHIRIVDKYVLWRRKFRNSPGIRGHAVPVDTIRRGRGHGVSGDIILNEVQIVET